MTSWIEALMDATECSKDEATAEYYRDFYPREYTTGDYEQGVTAMRKEPYPIKTILESLHDDVIVGKISLYEATCELMENGWMNFVDIEKAKRLLDLKGEQ